MGRAVDHFEIVKSEDATILGPVVAHVLSFSPLIPSLCIKKLWAYVTGYGVRISRVP
jgi:hypothetical protein